MPRATAYATSFARSTPSPRMAAFSPELLAAVISAHPDAVLFEAVANWRQASAHWEEVYGQLLAAKRSRSRAPRGWLTAARRVVTTERQLLGLRPRTPEGAAVMLEAAEESLEEVPAAFALVAAAIRGAVAVGV